MAYLNTNHVVFIILLYKFVKSDELKFVHILICHGDSTPSHLYPNDSNTEDTWPEGLSHLTKFGIEQEYRLGQYLRRRYVDQYKLLSPTYKRHELYVQSTDTSHTLMSSTALLEGLYPSTEAALWDPVPVHTRPLAKDPMLNTDIHCERFNREFLSILNTEEGKKFVSDNEEFINFVSEEAGYLNTSVNNVWDVYNPLQIEIWYNRSIPSWVTPEVFEQIKEMYFKKFEFLYHTQDQQKIKGGLFVTEIYNNTKKKIVGEMDEQRKMNIYMTTDSTIVAVLAALGIWDKNVPPAGAAVFFELYLSGLHSYTIRVLYKNDTRTDPFSDPYRVIMPGCLELCPVTTFYKKMEPFLIQNEDAWFIYCLWYPGSDITKGGVVALSVFSVVFLIGLVSLFVWCYRRQQQEVHYQPANFASEPRI